MIRRVVTCQTCAVVSAALLVLAMGGCTSTTPGIAGTTNSTAPTSTAPSSTTPSDPLASVDPCTLLAPAVISQNQLRPDTSGTGPGTRYCRWDTAATAEQRRLQHRHQYLRPRRFGPTFHRWLHDHQLSGRQASRSYVPRHRRPRLCGVHWCYQHIPSRCRRCRQFRTTGPGLCEATTVAPSVEQTLPG